MTMTLLQLQALNWW